MPARPVVFWFFHKENGNYDNQQSTILLATFRCNICEQQLSQLNLSLTLLSRWKWKWEISRIWPTINWLKLNNYANTGIIHQSQCWLKCSYLIRGRHLIVCKLREKKTYRISTTEKRISNDAWWNVMQLFTYIGQLHFYFRLHKKTRQNNENNTDDSLQIFRIATLTPTSTSTATLTLTWTVPHPGIESSPTKRPIHVPRCKWK